MKTIKMHLKKTTMVFAALILIQSCTVYKSANSTLDEAVKSETKVKVETNNNQTLKYKRIRLEDGKYYGVKEIKGEIVKTMLDEKYINKVRLKDKTMSTILTVAIPVVIIASVLAISVANSLGNWGSYL